MNKQIFSQTGFAVVAFLLCFFANAQTLIPDSNGIIYVKTAASGNGDGSSWNDATSNLQGAINATDVTKVFVAIGNYDVPSPNSFVMKNGVEIYGGFDPLNNITDLTHNRILPNHGVSEGSVLNGKNERPVIWNYQNGVTATAVLDGFTITGGYRNTNGGGIMNFYASPTLTNLVIKGNNADNGAAGIYNDNASPKISNVIIKENSAGNIGGGITNVNASSPELTNVLITGNTATNYAGGLFNISTGIATLTNVTIVGNSPDAVTINTGTVNLNNSLVFGTVSGTYTAQYSLVEGNTNFTNGNIDPTGIATTAVFTDAVNGDYTLLSTSPAVNTGNNSLNVTATDLAGNSRVAGLVIDMGAYEFSPIPLTPDANGIIYVKTSFSGLGNGSSWADATSDLHNAIHTENVQKVFVAVGNYPVGESSFVMKNGVEIYGGFDPDNGIIDLDDERILHTQGTAEGSVLDGENARPVVWNFNNGLDNTAVLDGFTIKNGYTAERGGGVFNSTASPLLNNLVIKNNSGRTGGCGMANFNNAATIQNTHIINNSTSSIASSEGGGVYNEVSTATFTNVIIKGNSLHSSINVVRGGGMYNSYNSSIKLTNVLVVDNSVICDSNWADGGGVLNSGSGSTFINVTVARNYASGTVCRGGGIASIGGSCVVRNSIVWGNTLNSIWDNNQGVDFYQSSGTTSVKNSLTQVYTGSPSDMNITGENPDFTNEAIGDYSLNENSPAINAGDDSYYEGLDENTLDLAGNARVYGATIDLGAYESTHSYIALTPDANGIIYVKETASGSKNGSDWDNATSNLKKAIQTTDVEQVWVATGTYQVNNIQMKNGVSVYGGFDPDNGIDDLTDSRMLPDPDANIEGAVLNGQNAGVIISNNNNGLDNTAVLDGFTLTNGKNSTGGAIYNNGASPTLQNLWIKENTATSDGGAMFNLNLSSPVMTNITIENNTANYAGGVFNRNSSSPVMTDVVIRNNTANNDGGAMYNDVSASPVMTNVTLTGNSAQNGAGIYNRTNSSPVITNALIANNTAVTNGGAIRNESNSSPQLINVTIANNSGSNAIYATDGSASFANSIVFGGIEGSFTSQYSLVEGIANILNGNIDGTAYVPSDVFTDNANGNYTLKDGAVVVNAGNNTFNTATIDLAGNARIYNNTIDFGAYESAYATITPDANNILYVNINGSGGNGSGNSWANAIPQLADALKYARLQYNADNTIYDATPLKIYVAKGTYKPLYSARNNYFTQTGSADPAYSDQDNAFVMVKNVQIYGGFDPDNGIDDLTDTRIFGSNGSILSGEIGNTWDIDYPFTNTNHVVIASGDVGNALLNGFTITRAFSKSTNAMLTVFIYPVLDAFGAMYCVRSSPTVENCIFTDNGTSGGNMFNYQQSSPTIINCTFINNGTAGNGGAIYNSTNSSPTITNCSFTENSAASNGGAIYNSSNSNPIITNCSFKNNSAYYNGGAIWNSASSPIITNSLFANNKARGGNISNPIGNGGAIYNESTSSPVLTNVSIADNLGSNAVYSTGTGSTTFNNSIVFGTVSATYTAQYSLVQGNTDFSNGNIDPTGITTTDIFTDATNGDYTLKENASAVNAGNNQLYWDTVGDGLSLPPLGEAGWGLDLAGNSRIADSVIDMGAYEFIPTPLTPDSNGIIYVKETATGEENGNSWANATADLHGAIKANGVQKVFVAVGNYPVGDQSFVMKNGVEIYGGFDPANGIDDLTDSRVLPTLSQEGSVLDGEGTKTVVSNEFTVDNPLYNTAVLDGFTLTNGSYPTLYGGGICNYYASPVLTNLIIKNSTANRGGGMYNEHSAPEVTNIVLHDNYGYRGSGVYNMESAPVFTNVTLSENEAGNGTIYNNTSSVVFTNIKITGNSAGNGAAVYNFDASAVFTNVEITENATDNGTNDAIIVNMFEQDMLFYNATIAYNNSPNIFDNVDAGEIRLKNSIVFNAIDDWNHFTAEHSFIQENEDDSNGNIVFDTYINEDDVFMNPDNGDFTLAIDSPVINLGNNALYPGLDENTLDLAGNPRLFGTTIDLGAYESNFAPASQHCLYATTWDGTQWSNGEPDYETQVIIDGELVVDNYLDACEIIVTANGSLRVLGYATLYTEWSVTNLAAAGAFVIENNGGLMQWEEEEANTGAITVKRESSPMFRLDYTLWSSPVADMKLIDFSDVSPTGGSGTLWNRVYTLGATAWNQVWTSQPDFETDTQEFETAKGYLYRSKNAWVTRDSGNPAEKDLGIFTGTPNNGTFNIDTPLAFNALGNPYPSSFSVNHFMYINSGVEAVYFWTNVNASNGASYQYNNWAYYNLSGGTGVQLEGAGAQLQIPDGIVLPGQGFVVGVTEGNTSVTFNNWMRETTNGGSLFFRQMDAERHRYWLNLANEEMTFNQILIAYLENATQGVDTGMDAKMFSYEGNALYSLIENSSENYVIQGRELPFTDTDVVPLGFRAVNAGSFTISLDHFDGLFEDGNTTIYLKDNFSQTQHNLNEEAYTFVSEEGVFNNRFEVVYQTTMSVENPDWQYNWVVFKQDKGFQIQTQGFELKQVSVYDMLGRRIYSSQAEGTAHQIPALTADGVYILKIITTEDKVLNKKVR